jgi:hypothetical protein
MPLAKRISVTGPTKKQIQETKYHLVTGFESFTAIDIDR